MIKSKTIRTLCMTVAGAFIITAGFTTFAQAEIVMKKETVIDRNINRGLLASPVGPRVVEKVVVKKKFHRAPVLHRGVEIDKKIIVR